MKDLAAGRAERAVVVGAYCDVSTWRYSSSSNTFGSKRTAIDLAGGTMVTGALGVQSGRVIIRYAEF